MLGLYLEALENSSDEELFTQVYERCKRLVYHTAYKVVQDSYLAEDVLQEVFLQLAKNFTRVYRDDAHKMAAYLAICAKSRAIDLLRAQQETVGEEDTALDTVADNAPLPEDAVIDAESAAQLTALLEKLAPIYKAPLQLKALGYTNSEIASAPWAWTENFVEGTARWKQMKQKFSLTRLWKWRCAPRSTMNWRRHHPRRN